VISTEIRCFVQFTSFEDNVLDVPDGDGFRQNYEFTRMLVEDEYMWFLKFFLLRLR